MIVHSGNLQKVLDVLRERSILSIDTETTGLEWTDRAFAIVVADTSDEYYFDDRQLERKLILEAILTLVKTPNKIFMNAKFDLRMIKNTWDVDLTAWGNIWDIEVMERLYNNSHMKYSLAEIAKRHGFSKSTAVELYITKNKLWSKIPYKYSEGTWTQFHYDKVPMQQMQVYAEIDARITFDIYWRLKKLLEDGKTASHPCVVENESRLTKTCFKMEERGVLVNTEYVRQAMKHENDMIEETKHRFCLTTGVKYDNKKTTLIDIFTKAGETIPKTLKGNPQLTDDVLESFTSPAANLVRKIRFHEKRISTYYSSFLELADSDGIIRANMRQAGTTTGRFSYSNPNLQNIPKEEDSTDPYVVRGSFKPRPGKVFVAMDYKQQEYRLMLAYAKHWQLIKEVMDGKDVHQATADLVGITRKQAKTLNFAILYGAGAAKIAWMLGIPELEARNLIRKYFDALACVQDFIVRTVNEGKSRGTIHNWFGRCLKVSSTEFAYVFPNHRIQSGGADICKIAMNRIDDAFPDLQMILQWHDALVFEMNKEDMPIMIPKIKQLMIDAYPETNGMKMDVDVTWSKTSLAERDMLKWNFQE